MKKLFLLIILLIIPIKMKAFSTSATSSILMDMDSGKILYSNNEHKIRPVASISKIMTCIVAIESGKINEEVIITDDVLKAYGSGIYIKPGEKLKLIDLLYGLMLRSGNDASIAIAIHVSGSVEKFVELMNKKAHELGMNDSTFNNPNGLDDNGGNKSSAYDMAILTRYCMKNEIYKKIVSTKKYTLTTNLNTYVWYNKHRLINTYKYATGGKTGFTDKARRTLVTTASKDNLNLVAVTLNDGNDFLDQKNLFEEAFKKYISYKILSSGDLNIYDEKYYSNKQLYIKEDFYYSMLKSEKKNIYLKINLKKEYSNGEAGYVQVIDNDKEIFNTKIYYKEISKEKSSLFKKIKNWWKSLW